jgi:hypothetical protein
LMAAMPSQPGGGGGGGVHGRGGVSSAHMAMVDVQKLYYGVTWCVA